MLLFYNIPISSSCECKHNSGNLIQLYLSNQIYLTHKCCFEVKQNSECENLVSDCSFKTKI